MSDKQLLHKNDLKKVLKMILTGNYAYFISYVKYILIFPSSTGNFYSKWIVCEVVVGCNYYDVEIHKKVFNPYFEHLKPLQTFLPQKFNV